MVRLLSVIFEGEEVGRLAWDERRRLSYFTYSPEFVNKGLNLFPLVAPVNGATSYLLYGASKIICLVRTLHR